MKKDIAIEVKDLKKTFKIPLEASNGLKQKLINTLKGRKGYREFTPLKDISFEIEKGDFFGIVGRNGSGKSTLLKTIAGIYAPEKGLIKVNGKLVPFIELGVGFNPELTGRENIFLNGALLGFSHSQMEQMYDDIVEFAELEDFMEERLKNYSSGMQVRLAFSIAIRAEGDILLLDEVLAVGDESFQKKCFAYFAELKKQKKTVVLVTHSMDAVQKFCTKAMMIDKGKIVAKGDTLEVSHQYQELFIEQSRKQSKNAKTGAYNDSFSCNATVDPVGEELEVTVTIKAKEEISDTIVTLGINRDNGEQVFRWISDDMLGKTIDFKKGREYKLTARLQNIFPKGSYTVGVRIKDSERVQNYAIFDEIERFDVYRRKGSYAWDVLWDPEKHVDLEEV